MQPWSEVLPTARLCKPLWALALPPQDPVQWSLALGSPVDSTPLLPPVFPAASPLLPGASEPSSQARGSCSGSEELPCPKVPPPSPSLSVTSGAKLLVFEPSFPA